MYDKLIGRIYLASEPEKTLCEIESFDFEEEKTMCNEDAYQTAKAILDQNQTVNGLSQINMIKLTQKQYRTLYTLARTTLWAANIWNDHNYRDLHTEIKESCEQFNTVGKCNDFLDSLPEYD